MRKEGDVRWKTIGIGRIEFHYLPWKYLPLWNKFLTIAGLIVVVSAMIMMLVG